MRVAQDHAGSDAHALARDAELSSQLLERDGLVREPAGFEDAPLAVVENGRCFAERLPSVVRLLALRQPALLVGNFASRVSLPRKGCRVGLRIVLFEACSAFTRVTACTLALSPIRDTHSEGFSYFVTSIAAPAASGWSVAGWDLHPLEGAALPRRTPTAVISRAEVLHRSIIPARVELCYSLFGRGMEALL
jgi:hypothetical protein